MTRFTRIPFVLGLAGLTATAALVGPAFADIETRPLAEFTKIQTASGMDVVVTCGSPARAVVTASSPEGLQRIKTEVEGQTLTIRVRGWGSWSGSSKVEITTPQPLNAMQSSSGSSLKADGCATDGRDLDVSVSSGASMALGGTTKLVKVSVSSGGDLKAGDLNAETGTVNVSSGGSADLCNVRSLSANASSGGSVHHGKDALLRIETSSGGGHSSRGCD